MNAITDWILFESSTTKHGFGACQGFGTGLGAEWFQICFWKITALRPMLEIAATLDLLTIKGSVPSFAYCTSSCDTYLGPKLCD